ncbi:MAG: helix-turn-helix domain-containing protein [bacterium]|nr:helix-turn-helix domain-containing protein [bacterium]
MADPKIKIFTFHKTKYGRELLVDFGEIENLKNFDMSDRPHYLTYYDIMVIREGKGSFFLDDNEYPVVPKKVIFSSPGQVRRWKVSGPVKGYVLFFEAEFISQFFNDTQFVQKFHFFDNPLKRTDLDISVEEFQKLKTFLEQIASEITAFKDYSEDMLRAVLYQVLVFLNRLYSSKYNIEPSQKHCMHTNRFMDLLEENFLTLKKVEDYAGLLNLTPNHLNYLSKKHFGCSAKGLINNRIILEAKRFLLYTELTVKEIGYRLSFEDPSYFVRYFKRCAGTTPFSFRYK